MPCGAKTAVGLAVGGREEERAPELIRTSPNEVERVYLCGSGRQTEPALVRGLKGRGKQIDG